MVPARDMKHRNIETHTHKMAKLQKYILTLAGACARSLVYSVINCSQRCVVCERSCLRAAGEERRSAYN